MKRPDDVELARGYTVERYRALEVAKDRAQIATLVSKRFTDRYLAPTLAQRNVKHGFTSMTEENAIEWAKKQRYEIEKVEGSGKIVTNLGNTSEFLNGS